MINFSRKTMGWLALGGAVAGAAAMLFSSKRGREWGSSLLESGQGLLSSAGEGLGGLKDKAMELVGGSEESKTKVSVTKERNENHNHLDRGDFQSGMNNDSISRGDSSLQTNQFDQNTGANIRRGDSGEEMIH